SLHVIEPEFHRDLRRELHVGVCLDALQHAVGGDVLNDWKALRIDRPFYVPAREPCRELVEPSVELLFGERRPEQIPADVVAEVRDLPGYARRPPAQRQVEAERMFGAQAGVPDLEGEITRVRPEVEQFLERGAPRRARRAERDREAIVSPRWPEQ